MPSATHHLRKATATLACMTIFATAANAVVLRGHVTDALGKPVPNARVQLIEDGKVVALAYAGEQGDYEIRQADAGRFTLLSSAPHFFPAISDAFYSNATDVLERDIVLASNTVKQDISVSATGIPTPLPQLTAPVSLFTDEALTTRVDITDTLRQIPGIFLVQTGQSGGASSLFLRGGNSTANLVLIDGVPADDIGGTFDFGTLSATGIGRVELYRGAGSAMYGTDAAAGVISLETPHGVSLKPQFDYTGDFGNLHTWRNEAALSGTLEKLDYFAAFSRFDTSNALALDRYHAATSALNVGYALNGATLLRLTLRDSVSATGIPGPHDFWGLSANGKQGDQDIYSAFTLDNRYHGNWHNLLRYAIARKRDQSQQFGNTGTLINTPLYGPEYFGPTVTIRGANGYRVTGHAQIYGSNDDQDSNRDQLYYQGDYDFSPHFIALFGFRYDNERGSFNDADYALHQQTQRTNFEYNLQFQGEFFHRLFYSAGGAFEKNHLYGTAGTPKLGLAYAPVRPSTGYFHGTRLHANAATGVQEPSLAIESNSLYTELLQSGDTADIAAFHIRPQTAARSRTYNVGIDQNILGERLILKGGYFHNIFDRQLEGVSGPALAQYFHITSPFIYNDYAYVNSLAFRAQGAEIEAIFQPKLRLLIRGGYTFLASTVLQSFASDAVAAQQGTPTTNPLFPTIAIGAESPLLGARPFRRPPSTGFVNVLYTRPRWTFTAQAAMAGKSDDSTFLDGEDTANTNTLLLPNRDLDFGYTKLDLGITYAFKPAITLFLQGDNLLNDQHIGPIGFPASPLTVRLGLKLRLGGD